MAGANYKQMTYILLMQPTNRVRELRKRAGISQAELARMAGISQPAISQVENDTRPLTVDWMRTFARIFGVTPADILCEEDNPHRLSAEELALLEHYRTAGDAQREMVQRVAEPLRPFHHESEIDLRHRAA